MKQGTLHDNPVYQALVAKHSRLADGLAQLRIEMGTVLAGKSMGKPLEISRAQSLLGGSRQQFFAAADAGLQLLDQLLFFGRLCGESVAIVSQKQLTLLAQQSQELSLHGEQIVEQSGEIGFPGGRHGGGFR